MAAGTSTTTEEYPFLTTDRGFVGAEDLRIGEQIRQLDGGYGVVVALQHIFGVAVRYNLTVQDDHTYAVGADQWVVHNTCENETFERYGSEDEAKSAEENQSLSQRLGHNGPDGGKKWIADEGVVNPRQLGGKWRKTYNWMMKIITKPGTREWLKSIGAADFKFNEFGRYAISNQFLDEFNDRIVSITIQKIG